MLFKYLWYLIRHRWFVMLACFREGLYWQGLIHDWSKFLPDEYLPYATYFYGGEVFGFPYGPPDEVRQERLDNFNRAWLAHQHRNPHHWQHWVLREDSGKTFALPMPHKYRLEMVCDWQGAGRAITGKFDSQYPYAETAAWYKKNADKMILHEDTRKWVEGFLHV